MNYGDDDALDDDADCLAFSNIVVSAGAATVFKQLCVW